MEQATFSAPRVMRLGRNEKGRDFVVGDIHGAFDLVIDAMKAVSFDPEADRLLSVGDLIDRGPGSHRCAAFLAQPYVYAVRGNHEDMLIELYADGAPESAVLEFAARNNGFAWWLDVPEEQRQQILDAIRKLPLAIELETARGTVGLIHADVPRGMTWSEFLDALEAGDAYVIKTCLWGRARILSADDAGVLGVGRVFVGHTPQWDGVTRFGNVYAVDTGAVFGQLGIKDGCLTMVEAMARTAVLTAPRAHFELFDLREGGLPDDGPYGAYARTETEAPDLAAFAGSQI